MDYVTIGKSDLKVSAVGFGAWQAGKRGWGSDYTDEDSVNAIRFALESGVNLIDTAEIYGNGHSEEVVSRAIKDFPREEIVIATKISASHFKFDNVLKAAEHSLRRLGTDYIDLYQLHWPDGYIRISETISAMEKLVDDGKIRYIGLCNFPRALIEEIYDHLKKNEIVSDQMRYNIIQNEVEDDLVPYLKYKGISLIAWSPIAKGLLSGKYDANNLPNDPVRTDDPLFRQENIVKFAPLIDKLREVAEKRGKTMAQVSLNFLLSKDAIVIPGAKNPKQVQENIGAAGWRLSEKEMGEIEELSKVAISYF